LGSFSRQDATRRSSTWGTSCRIERTVGGFSSRWQCIIAGRLSTKKGRRPVSISKRMMPNA